MERTSVSAWPNLKNPLNREDNKSQNASTQTKLTKEKKIRKPVLKKKTTDQIPTQQSKSNIPQKKTGSCKGGLLPPIKQQTNV